MDSAIQSPSLFLAATMSLYKELPTRLPAERWEEIRQPLELKMAKLSSPDHQAESSMTMVEIVQLLARDETTRSLFAERLAAQDLLVSLRGEALAPIKQLVGAKIDDTNVLAAVLECATIQADSDSQPKVEATTSRGIWLKPGGIGGAKSIKIRNFRIDFGDLAKLASVSLVSMHSALKDYSALLMAAGALTLIQSLLVAVTRPVSEDEASVFWSFIQLAGNRENKTATKTEIKAATQKERKRFGLPALGEKDFTKTMKQLESLSSVKAVGKSSWRLVEAYHVRK